MPIFQFWELLWVSGGVFWWFAWSWVTLYGEPSRGNYSWASLFGFYIKVGLGTKCFNISILVEFLTIFHTYTHNWYDFEYTWTCHWFIVLYDLYHRFIGFGPAPLPPNKVNPGLMRNHFRPTHRSTLKSLWAHAGGFILIRVICISKYIKT